MTQEQMSAAMQLALYRVGDRLKESASFDIQNIGSALRQVADELYKICNEREQDANDAKG